MIDFHTHILHRIDDGSRSLEESITMLKMCFLDGIDTVVLTPHFRPGEYGIDEFIRQRQMRVDEIRARLTDEERLIIPKFTLGAEIEYVPDMNRWSYLDRLTIGGTNYMLTEMPFIPWSDSVVKTIDDIALNTPFTPILPHIDRYFYNFTPKKYIEHYYKADSVLIQMNAIFINSQSNIQFFKPMFESGKIDLIGSDCHSCEWRQPDLGSAIAVLRKTCGQGILDRIDALGRNILKDADVQEF